MKKTHDTVQKENHDEYEVTTAIEDLRDDWKNGLNRFHAAILKKAVKEGITKRLYINEFKKLDSLVDENKSIC